MKRAIITGSRGFVGIHLCEELEKHDCEVIKCDLNMDLGTVEMDIMNPQRVFDVIKQYRPDMIFNLAGQANVGLSWSEPQRTVELNVVGLINILEAVRKFDTEIRVIAMGSSDEYGSLKEYGLNVTESMELNPITPYAISKQSQELFAQLYCRCYGMNICMIRMFNIGGAGQPRGYMISDFASDIAEIESNKKTYISVGNLESARDFTHVSDACRAIRLVAEKGRSGEIYNIASGNSYKAKEILDKLIARSNATIKVIEDINKIRHSDTPIVCGNHDKVTADTGWYPQLGIEEIIDDTLKYWRERQ